MIIIIEGPDGSGKTSLANQISEQTGWPILHRDKPKTDEEKVAMYNNYMQIACSSRNVIMDRSLYSELVYGPIMRDKSVISFYQMYTLERRMATSGAMIIYCTDKEAALWKRATKRGEGYITSRNDFKAICEAYDDLFSIPHLIPVTRYTIPS